MSTKLLKYGIGIFTPEFPAGFVPPETDKKIIVVKAGEKIELTEDASSAMRHIELHVGAGAEVTYRVRQDGPATADFVRRDIRLAEGAKLSYAEWVSGPTFARSTTEVRLEGEGASIEYRAAYVGNSVTPAQAGAQNSENSFLGSRLRGNDELGQSFDSELRVLHLAPRTRSNLVTKTVLDGKSKAIVRGLVRIPKGVAGCEGFQREDALLLSPTAVASAIPMLEIENNDVKCGHAATTGRVDEDKLFYLMSRGLDRDEAVKAIVEGFLEPVFRHVFSGFPPSRE